MHYIFKADEGEAPNAPVETSTLIDSNGIKIVAPQAWTGNRGSGLSESSFDLHHGLHVDQDEIDTVPAELLAELFKI